MRINKTDNYPLPAEWPAVPLVEAGFEIRKCVETIEKIEKGKVVSIRTIGRG
tara:strand:- start:2998 stop:3153 length:156 start_codon:yes stop_codon:yes gene_type:complete